ncbi:hypothetical protein HQ32_04791 [Prauserella sp. Am3]|nr:hypothetical protein HQ32_04791 [Prauserella sp. Am3]
MIKLTVLYDTPTDPTAFDRHYFDIHVPLARKVPGLDRIEVTRFAPGPDGAAPRYHLMAELYFRDQDAMQSALSSPEGTALGADTPNLATPLTHLIGSVDA